MLHIISDHSKPIEPTDRLRNRIAAKQTLWTHLLSILPELRFAAYGNAELVDQLISDSIEHLHPHFSGPEIFNEVQTAAITFMIPQPDQLHSTFTTAYFHSVTNKIKLNVKDSKTKRRKS